MACKKNSGASEERYASSRFALFFQISQVFPHTIFAAVRTFLNHLVMEYFFHSKKKIHFDSMVNIVFHFVATDLGPLSANEKRSRESIRRRISFRCSLGFGGCRM
uniref:Uncharacterized protein n=1 Tax=Anthoceros agrestis TaxID=41834 RepID=A0A6M8B253_9EMBR|nr:hypothetical protein [Anthoceros agrestis]QKD76638.1 hypothetical protein [Anthoceros agrestis]